MHFTGPSAPGSVFGTSAGSVTTIDLTSSFTLGTDGMAVTGVSGVTNYGGGSPTMMTVKLYSGTHVVNLIVGVPGGSTNQPFYIPLAIPARFAAGLRVDLRATYAWATIAVSDLAVHYTPLPL